jgi:hypothetical protein
MTRIRLAFLAAALIGIAPRPAPGQVLTPPTRAADIIARSDTATSTQSLVVSTSLFGGYDTNDNQSSVPTDPNAPPVFLDSYSTVLFDAGMDYSHNRRGRFIGFNLNGSGTLYGQSSEIGQARSFDSAFRLETPLGAPRRLSLDQRVAYSTLYSLGAFTDLASGTAPGDVPSDPLLLGVSELGSVNYETLVGLTQRIGRRGNLSGQLGYVRQENNGTDFGDSSSKRANLVLSRQMNRVSTFNVTYAYSNGEFTSLNLAGTTRPLVGHSVQGGYSYSKRLSPNRAILLSVGLGASRTTALTGLLEEGEYSFWAPGGSASVRVDLGRTWALSADYGHAVTSLSGLTGEAYVADTFGTSLGGNFGRFDVSLMAGLGRGSTGVDAALASDYTTQTFAAQTGFAVTRRLHAVVQYNYYGHDVSGDAEVGSAVPATFSRHSARAGLTLRLPIITAR